MALGGLGGWISAVWRIRDSRSAVSGMFGSVAAACLFACLIPDDRNAPGVWSTPWRGGWGRAGGVLCALRRPMGAAMVTESRWAGGVAGWPGVAGLALLGQCREGSRSLRARLTVNGQHLPNSSRPAEAAWAGTGR